ncbi:MAG: accumulation regulator DNA-binding domain protein [Rickettsiaceae bacterium]|nr:accumulation regulator DNA-binding domain protein [Rickettsiaceae bacterium]
MTLQIIIKKYPNRRLYDTSTSQYVTLENLFTMIKEGKDFRVEDVKTKEDLTKNVLTQIIFEQEAKGYNILPESFLKHIIKMYDNNLQNLFSLYLEQAVKEFSRNIEAWENLGNQYKDQPFSNYTTFMNQGIDFYRKFFELFSTRNKDNE